MPKCSTEEPAAPCHGSSSKEEQSPELKSNEGSPDTMLDDDKAESSSREMLEAAARSLRTKFDHIGIDPHSSAISYRDVNAIAETRSMTNSPPPPSLSTAAAAGSSIALPGHTSMSNFVRQHSPEQNADHPMIAHLPSPMLFSRGSELASAGPDHATINMHLMHLHQIHVTPVAVGLTSPTPFNIVAIEASGGGNSRLNATNLPGLSSEGADIEVC